MLDITSNVKLFSKTFNQLYSKLEGLFRLKTTRYKLHHVFSGFLI